MRKTNQPINNSIQFSINMRKLDMSMTINKPTNNFNQGATRMSTCNIFLHQLNCYRRITLNPNIGKMIIPS